ncbi:MAG: methylamine utilization protein [Gammaproteobacteria bacterium]|nr:methylamine utilization protein [Gammaproteobacteria bacterium]
MNKLAITAKHFFYTIAATGAITSNAHAFDLNLMFVDELENPVAGAVIELAADNAEAAAASPQLTAIMDQIERRFVPMVLLVDAGQSVDFPNSDNVRHHVYSFSEIKQFSTPLYADENIEPVLFDKPGIAVLGCNIHDSMVGYVYVSQSPYRAISDNNGTLHLDGLPANPGTVSVWHPWLQTPDNRLDIDVTAIADGSQLRVSLPVKSPETRFGFRALVPEA